ncbi:hypothetical protein Y032_0069g292 [Ancylostoma ceylanicum]|uniref:Glycosyl hydrolase family 38 C-terminal domain-containing protein n=1 Tax=Ancylostoma ceylanicum TaxID=53326 RepID=A0A016TX26_9BILA|nr:hypothetical protein Y032_0069g292 [Ancylostoma ceylanicum]
MYCGSIAGMCGSIADMCGSGRKTSIRRFATRVLHITFSVFKLEVIQPEGFFLKNEELKTSHDKKNGLLTHITTVAAGRTTVSTNFYRYEPALGGAYIMRVNGPAKPHTAEPTLRFIARGSLQQKAHLFLPNIYEEITVKNLRGSFGQQVYLLLRVDITGTSNTELSMRLETSLQNPRFYADSAGMQVTCLYSC